MEDDKKQSAVYVGENDEIVEIIDKIKNIPGKSVTLVVPKDSVILQDVTNLKILQKKAEELGKEVSISKSSANISGLPEAMAATKKIIEPEMAVLPHIKSAVHGANAARPMSDMVRKSETVDLRNMNREKIEEAPKTEGKISEEAYSRSKYFSDEVLPAREKKETDPVLSEIKTLPLDEIAEEKYPVEESTHAKTEPEEVYWEKLAEKKVAERGDETETLEGIFDNRTRVEPEYDAKSFDFSYPENNAKSKKKKFSILPTISARFFAIFILLGVVTASLALFFILPKADIKIALKEESVEGDFTFVLDEKATAIDADADKVPVKTTEVKSEKTQSFNTTSKKRVTEKAVGNIIILNECSTGPQTLVAGTRFLSKDGKVFKIEEAANVPGFTKPEDEIVAGEKLIKVVAEVAGEASNIAATTFTIPKLQELASWKYSCLYARSEQSMTGGSDKEVAYVSQEDYDKAKTTMLALVQKENDDKISGQTSSDAVFLSNKNDAGTVEEKSSIAVGGLGESFDFTVTVKKPVLSINKSDLKEILDKKILAINTYANAKPVEGSLEYEVSDLISKDKQLSVDVAAKKKFAFEIDQDKMKKEIAGKNKAELNEYFAKMSGVESVSVNFWPFWVTRVPESVDKINIDSNDQF